jgi:phosphate transport system permease protein
MEVVRRILLPAQRRVLIGATILALGRALGETSNAIVGSLVLCGLALLFAAPIGVSAGIYLSEHGDGWVGRVSRFLSDVLVGVPYIVLGYFGYITMVIHLGWDFSLLAGAITLAIMMLPYIARISELALRAVPRGVREAAYGLGCREGLLVLRILLPTARAQIITVRCNMHRLFSTGP